MLKATRNKGNWSYILFYNDDKKCYSFSVFVKIRSKKKIAELNSTREKTKEITFSTLSEINEKNMLNNEFDLLVDMLKELEHE